eukprot:CAMPEP_0197717562 /NCGR_PEP_ID=MMETSP1434-20131217/2059_1 /TAXON_ID=265543 /ORGANISM="Minutocellus polymorphus, Strain CCMP3303" /LENGTH=167 /DNA_ID=CAMNT_0043302107 /DNA_START=57 /DNA_END=560 /DNA_ORIENTATION=+
MIAHVLSILPTIYINARLGNWFSGITGRSSTNTTLTRFSLHAVIQHRKGAVNVLQKEQDERPRWMHPRWMQMKIRHTNTMYTPADRSFDGDFDLGRSGSSGHLQGAAINCSRLLSIIPWQLSTRSAEGVSPPPASPAPRTPSNNGSLALTTHAPGDCMQHSSCHRRH